MLSVFVHLMALAGRPAAAADLAFTDVTDPDVFVQYRAMETSASSLDLNRHPAPAWADWDGDGDLDLPGYRNDGGTFVDVSASSGLLTWGHYRGAVWGDYDGDGDLDASVLAYSYEGQPDRLYRNEGDGTFTDIAPSNGMDMAVQGETSAWADYDGDGDLDLVTPNYHGGALWRNDGGDVFTDVLDESGVTMDVTSGADACSPGATTRPEGVTWLDVDDDGWLDLYVAGRLWQNQGDGTFVDISATSGALRVGYHDESFAPSDIDGDGDLDLAIYYQYCADLVLLEREAGGYVERGSIPTTNSMIGLRWADGDNDGDQDLFVPDYYPPYYNTWFRNDGDWNFEQVSDWLTDPSGGSGQWNGAIGSFGDYDDDGDLDLTLWKYDQPADPLVQVRVLRNDQDPDGGWLKVRVLDELGHPTQPGAVVRLSEGDRFQTRYVDGGTDWAVDAYDVHFAVDDERVVQIEVAFPRRIGEDRLVIGPSASDCLEILPRRLASRTVEVWRDGTVWIDGAPCAAEDTGGGADTGSTDTGDGAETGAPDSQVIDADSDTDADTSVSPNQDTGAGASTEDKAACGCGAAPSSPGWLLALPLLAVRRRSARRRA